MKKINFILYFISIILLVIGSFFYIKFLRERSNYEYAKNQAPIELGSNFIEKGTHSFDFEITRIMKKTANIVVSVEFVPSTVSREYWENILKSLLYEYRVSNAGGKIVCAGKQDGCFAVYKCKDRLIVDIDTLRHLTTGKYKLLLDITSCTTIGNIDKCKLLLRQHIAYGEAITLIHFYKILSLSFWGLSLMVFLVGYLTRSKNIHLHSPNEPQVKKENKD